MGGGSSPMVNIQHTGGVVALDGSVGGEDLRGDRDITTIQDGSPAIEGVRGQGDVVPSAKADFGQIQNTIVGMGSELMGNTH